ncbi:hypothetical protein HOG21_01820 [bacterium]|jgi:hypothetical protein|nr:hypothetical protein [bacterium]
MIQSIFGHLKFGTKTKSHSSRKKSLAMVNHHHPQGIKKDFVTTAFLFSQLYKVSSLFINASIVLLNTSIHVHG